MILSFTNFLNQEIKRSIVNKSFLKMVLALTIIMSFIPVKIDDVYTVNVIELIKNPAIRDSIDYQSFINAIRVGSFTMFTPLIVGGAVMPSILEDRIYKRDYFVLMRVGRGAFIYSKALTCVIVGGGVVTCACAVFGIFAFALIPTCAELSIIKWLLGAFLYGAMCGFWVFVLGCYINNRYLLICCPFIFFWYIERKINVYFSFAAGNSWVMDVIRRMYASFYVYSLPYNIKELIVFLMIYISLIIVWGIFVKYKRGKGLVNER